MDGVFEILGRPQRPIDENTGDKRLAVQVEDHPFDYRKFEGSIPKGEYGGGQVIVWDEGTYAPEGHLTAREQLAKGDFKFQLFGEKLRGSFVLVRLRTQKSKPEWLLIKHRDSFADANWDAEQHAESVLTGRTLEDIAAGRPGSGKRRVEPSEIAGAVEAPMPMMPKGVPATLAQLQEHPFSHPDWVFEIKWDGVRAIAQIDGGKTTLWARSGRDITQEYPEFKDLPSHFRVSTAIVDGEIAALDENGRSDFHKLQNRLGAQNPSQKLIQSIPVNYYFFDLPYAAGYDLRKASLADRKELLKSILLTDGRIHYSEHIPEQGVALFEAAREKGLEGIIGKRVDSPYAGTRTSSWVKLKIVRELDAVVAGYTAPRGGRKHFGALVLGLYDKRELKFIGNVGTGLRRENFEALFEQLQDLKTSRCPFREVPAIQETVQWLKPELVARVKYGNWTHDAHLRVPVFLSLRNDRTPQDCTFEDALPSQSPEAAAPPQPATPDPSKKVPPEKIVKSRTPAHRLLPNRRLPIRAPTIRKESSGKARRKSWTSNPTVTSSISRI